MTEKETLDVFVKKVARMRIFQKQYFQKRDRKTLQISKAMEREVDVWLAEYERTGKFPQVLF